MSIVDSSLTNGLLFHAILSDSFLYDPLDSKFVEDNLFAPSPARQAELDFFFGCAAYEASLLAHLAKKSATGSFFASMFGSARASPVAQARAGSVAMRRGDHCAINCHQSYHGAKICSVVIYF